MPRKTDASEPDPNGLKRVEAGRYLTADARFEVRSSGVGWMLLDTEAADGFGQPLARGPFATRDQAREAIPDARRATLKPVKGRRKGSGFRT